MMPLIRVLVVSLCLSSAIASMEPTLPEVSSKGAQIGTIVAGPSMLEPRSGHSATLLPDGRILIAGGMRRNQDFYKSAELYDPLTQRFQPTGEMAVARVGHAAVLLPSGKVLIAGGWTSSRGITDTAELYDPKTGVFTSLGSMTTKRARASATLLQNGDVLITGGQEHDGRDGVESAEIFQAQTAKFRVTGSMHHARFMQTATLLKDGRVLVVGGNSGGVISSAELYDPRAGKFIE